MTNINFSNIASPFQYQEAAFLAREAAQALISRLDLMRLNPRWILDAGVGVGDDLELLQKKFPQAQVLGVDIAAEFLQEVKGNRVIADAHILPLRDASVDVIFSNMLLPWCANPLVFLREWRRVLRPNGLLIFSCLGPDTFKEMQAGEFLPSLVDMHNVGDALLAEGFTDPVLEVEDITLTYKNLEQMQQELQLSGMLKGSLPADQELAVTFEIVYAHAWCPAVSGFKADASGEVRIPVSKLKRK